MSEFPLLRLMDNLNVGAAIIEESGRLASRNLSFLKCLEMIDLAHADDLAQIQAAVNGRMAKRLRNGSDCYWLVELESKGMLIFQYFGDSRSIYGPNLKVLTAISFAHHPVPKPGTLRKLFGLSATEANVCILVSRGLTVASIATETGTTEHTVRAHLKHIFQKTHTSTQGQLAHVVRRCSLLPSLADAVEDVQMAL